MLNKTLQYGMVAGLFGERRGGFLVISRNSLSQALQSVRSDFIVAMLLTQCGCLEKATLIEVAAAFSYAASVLRPGWRCLQMRSSIALKHLVGYNV